MNDATIWAASLISALALAGCGDDTGGSSSGGGSGSGTSSSEKSGAGDDGTGAGSDGTGAGDETTGALTGSSSGGGDDLTTKICDQNCDCVGCSPDERDSCVDDVNEAKDVAESDGCGDAYQAYAECVYGASECVDSQIEADGCDDLFVTLNDCVD